MVSLLRLATSEALGIPESAAAQASAGQQRQQPAIARRVK
jgi:hypothetical protein